MSDKINLHLPKTDYSKSNFTSDFYGHGDSSHWCMGGKIEVNKQITPKLSMDVSIQHDRMQFGGDSFSNTTPGISFTYNFLGNN